MTPSDVLFHQIRWDPRFDAARWTLGAEVRRTTPARIPLVDFVPGGDIPWHRVLFFEADGVVVWDRRTGTDHTATATVGRRTETAGLPEATWTARTALAWDGAAWTASEHSAAPRATGDTVLSWNVLFDRYDDGRLASPTRRPLQAAAIAVHGASIIALQEVEWPLLAALLAHPEVRRRYYVALSGPLRDVGRDGLVVLTAGRPRAAGHVRFGPHKGAIGVLLDGPAGPMLVANTHLTSAHSKGAPRRRQAELTTLRRAIDAVEAHPVVLGDFNDPGEVPNTALGLRDVGPRVPTFDPARNPLAAWSSLTGMARRIDRVLVGPGLTGTDPALHFEATVPVTDAPLSDHYGVSVTLVPARSSTGPQVAHAATPSTALAWLPSAETRAVVDPVRSMHDPAMERWPAHVNVAYPCVPEHAFVEAVAALAPMLATRRPFSVRLAETRSFDTGARRVRWADPVPTPATAWSELGGAVDARLAGCVRRHRFRPHLTLGAPPAALPTGTDLTDAVDALVLLSRRGDGPMRPRVTLPLGGGPPVWHTTRGPGVVPVESPEATTAATAVAAQIAAALPDCAVHTVGSRALGTPLHGSDLDLVIVSQGPAPVAERLQAALPHLQSLRAVTGARLPGVQLHVGGLQVDLACVALPTSAVSIRAAVEHRTQLAEPLERALSAVSDAQVLRRHFAPHGERGLRLLRSVRAWARARGLHSRPLGGLPGLGWSVLVAASLDHLGPAGEPLTDLQTFFELWADDALDQPVALQPRWAGAAGLPLEVCTPSAPFRACSDAVTPAMARLIRAELLRAWELLVDGETLSRLLAPPPLHQRHVAWAEVVVSAPADVGRVRGRMRAFLDALPADDFPGVHAWPEPWTSTAGHHLAVGLGRSAPDADTLRNLLAPWRRTCAPLSVEVTHRSGSALEPPTWPGPGLREVPATPRRL